MFSLHISRFFLSVPPKIIDEWSSSFIEAREGDTVELVCNVTGVPPPMVTWYKQTEFYDARNREGLFLGEGEFQCIISSCFQKSLSVRADNTCF